MKQTGTGHGSSGAPVLAGRVAVVTGSDSGIGQAIAVRFAAEGADVCVTYHTDEDGANETRRRVEAEGRRAIVLQVDVREETEVERMFDRTIEELGVPDILVNNAAVNADGTEVADMESDWWDTTLRTNLYGPFYACRRFIRERRKRGRPDGSDSGSGDSSSSGGRIINISSVHEEIPTKGGGAYDASKGALRMFMRGLALEVADDGITVNNIAPGMILTPMNQEAMEDPAKRREQSSEIPLRRAGRPEEVAGVALYLASPESDYVTGETIFIDGGLRRVLGQVE